VGNLPLALFRPEYQRLWLRNVIQEITPREAVGGRVFRSRKQTQVVVGLAVAVLFAGACSRSPEEKYARFVASGKKKLESHDYSQAALDFLNATQVRPRDAEPYYQLALAYLNSARVKEAVVALRRATELNPKHSAAQLKLAELMIQTHNQQLTKDAVGRIQTVLTANPSDDDALFMLAATQAQIGKPEDAEKYLSEVLERSPQHLKSAIAMAQVKLSQKDFQGSEAILKKAVELSPKSSDTVAALGTLYAVTGKLADAEGVLRKAVELDPNNAGALTALGAVQLRAGKKSDAEQTYKQIAALPQNEHRLAYAVFLMQQNRRADAITELKRLVKADRNDRIARSALVAGYLAENRVAEAEALLNEALKSNGSDLEALLQRSQIYLRASKLNEAKRDLDVVLRSDPSAQAHYLMAKIYRAQGSVLQQKQELNEALRMAPDSLRVRLDLAYALLASNGAKAAWETLEGAQAAEKRSLPYVVAHNWVLIALGESGEARKGVDAVLAAVKTPEVLLQDGILKFAAQDFARARVSLEEMLKADPEDVRALTILAQTYLAQKQERAGTERIRQLVAQRPKSEPLQMFWADWLVENNQRAEARQALAAAKGASPKDASPQLMLASLDYSEGRLDNARQTLTAVIAADQGNTDAHMLMGEVEDASNHYSDAVDHYKKVVAAEDRNIFALNNLAFALSRDSQQLDEAMRYAQKAKELAPESSQIQDTLGWIYYRKGMYPMAARELEGALAKGVRPAIQYHLGLAYKQLGKSLEGGRLIAAALAVDPKLAETATIP
jgi:tetratricopeptide (TPR) repeat protein